MARDIWTSQPRFHRTQGKQAQRLLEFPVFRAAYDFMCIQAMVGLSPYKLSRWWTDYQADQGERPAEEQTEKARRPRRRRRKRSAD
jgi:poly(A) polymerase